MASYLVLSPEAANADPMEDRFVKDGFSWLAALLPVPWTIAHGLYRDAIGLLVLRSSAWLLMYSPDLFVFGVTGLLLTSLIYGFEARNRYAGWLARHGFQHETVIRARDVVEAEEIFYGRPDAAPQARAGLDSIDEPPHSVAGARPSQPTLGMINFERGRR